MHKIRLISFVLITAFLAACQSVPKSEGEIKEGGQFLEQNNREQYSSAAFTSVGEVRGKVSAWQLAGSFSYVDPEESGAGRIRWSFQGDLLDNLRLNDVIDQERVRLIGPIGTGSVELVSKDNRASLISGNQTSNGVDAESLLFNLTGWRLPVSEMRYWLFGMPSPNASGKFWLNEQGQLQTLQQSEWEIQFDRYVVDPILQQAVPKKITAVHRGNQAKVKLVIKSFAPATE